MSTENQPPRVIVTDVQMPFGSMVLFMVKWAFAAIPAVIILVVAGALAFAFIGGVTSGVGALWREASAPKSEPAPYTILTPDSAANMAPTTNVPQYAERCKGNPEVEKCIAFEKRLAQETPAQRKARQDAFEAERQANMAKVH